MDSVADIQNQDVRRIDRYGRYLVISIATLLTIGVAFLLFTVFSRLILEPVIAIEPERLRPFTGPVCPGDVAEAATVTYVINRPAVLLVDAVIYDTVSQRAVPSTEIETTARPSPYAVRESRAITFAAPNIAPGKYEYQIAVSTRGELAKTAFWFVEFEIKEGCDPLPTAEPTP